MKRDYLAHMLGSMEREELEDALTVKEPCIGSSAILNSRCPPYAFGSFSSRSVFKMFVMREGERGKARTAECGQN